MRDTSYLQARVEDRACITALLMRYCNLARDDADWDAIAALFTPDAKFRLEDGTGWSRSEISNVVQGDEASYIRHHGTTVDIRWDSDPDIAHAETFYLAITDEAGLDHWGTWRDTLAKQSDGSWLIADRLVTAEGADPDGWLMRAYAAGPPSSASEASAS
ncbi:MAG: nuclear transport factor 2 family protein [Solirubrobacterales bacterium]